MAFRIHDSVVRGEIDNRVKGIVRGKIWIKDRADPVVLELKGNAWPDLAGCLLTFRSPLPPKPHQHLESLNAQQTGQIGDLTASRKVRVMEIPMPEAYLMKKRGEHVPEHLANSLYLEWFSEQNGRVVIESTDYELNISAPEWRLTPEEDEQRAKDAANGMSWFMQKLSEAIELQQRGQKDHDAEWNEHDYEKLLKESDARTEKYMELLEKYGDSDNAQEIIAREMGWDKELSPEAEAERHAWIEEMNQACDEALDDPEPELDPAREGLDWMRTEDGDLKHPLQHRCKESAMRFWDETEALGDTVSQDTHVVQFITEWLTTGAKLAGALDGVARGEAFHEAAFLVAYLKRALDHLHKAQAGLEAAAQKAVLPEKLVGEARTELFEIREGILKLMDAFRGR
jgi:hypothetical protein